MAIGITCPHCNAQFIAANQWLASIAFDAHACEKHKPVIQRVCPMLQPKTDSDGARDLSIVSTMEIFEHVKRDASNFDTCTLNFDRELWQHLETRLKYLLDHSGLR